MFIWKYMCNTRLHSFGFMRKCVQFVPTLLHSLLFVIVWLILSSPFHTRLHVYMAKVFDVYFVLTNHNKNGPKKEQVIRSSPPPTPPPSSYHHHQNTDNNTNMAHVWQWQKTDFTIQCITLNVNQNKMFSYELRCAHWRWRRELWLRMNLWPVHQTLVHCNWLLSP